MEQNKVLSEIERFEPYNEQEVEDKRAFIKYLNNFKDILYRENSYGHITSSAWVVNKNRNKVLMIYHNIYNTWAWTGGHADGDNNLINVAIREVQEETGIKNITPISYEIFTLDIIPVWGHIKKGKYVSSHQHLNVTYLLEADEDETVRIKADENSGVKWIDFKEINKYCSEKQMYPVYHKIIDKMKKL